MGTKRIDERRRWRRHMSQHGVEYMKLQFTCPYCGGLFGCSEDGKIGMYSIKILQRHKETCSERKK